MQFYEFWLNIKISFLIIAQLQQRFDILETKLTGFGKKNKTNLQETENINNLKEQGIFESL